MRCNEGDVAWITGEPVNQGKLVEVGPAAPEDTHDGRYGHCWFVMSLSGPLRASTRLGRAVYVEIGVIPDLWLTPHRPPKRAEEEPAPDVRFDLTRPVPTIGVV